MARPMPLRLLQSLPWTCRRCQSHTKQPELLKTANRMQRKRYSAAASLRVEELQIRAAPEIDLDTPVSKTQKPARVIPASPSYFTASPQFNDDVLLLRFLVQRNETTPILPPDRTPRVPWLKLSQYRSKVGEPVSASKYSRVLLLLQKLNRIHPQLRSEEVNRVIEQFRRPGNVEAQKPKAQELDIYGRAKGIGRRKEASARVYLVEGTGEILVNGKSIVQAFPRLHDRESALWALKTTERMNKYNVWALVEGGGVTGQAESITLALARALLVHEPALKPALRRGKPLQHDLARRSLTLFAAGTVTADARRVERKKPGRLKARKKPAWVKR